MKIAIQTIRIILLFSVINVQAMAKMAIETLEKRAWQEAFQGNAAAALETFTQAANNGSLHAAKLLAYNYGKESLFDQKDETKAQLFVQLAERYKQENPREYFPEFMLTSKIEKYKSLQFACVNPWYQEVLDVLNSSHSAYTKEYPTPEQSIMKLFFKIKDDKTDKQIALNCMRLLTQTMSQVQSEQATRDIFARVNNGYSGFRFCNDAPTNYRLSKEMIKTLEESALKLGLKDDIKTAYENLFSSFECDYNGQLGYEVEKPVIVQTIQELFPSYAALDHQKAVTSISDFLECYVEHCRDLDDNFLKLLRLLPDQEIGKYVTNLPDAQWVNIVRGLCKYKDIAPMFQGTVLDLDPIIQNALCSDMDKKGVSILIALFKNENKDFYKKYQEDIIAALPAFMKKIGHEYKVVIKLATDSDIPFLQQRVPRILVEYTANMQEDSGWKKLVIECLLENEKFSSDQKNKLYQLMDEIYQAQKCIYGLQLLWLHLKDNQDQRELVRASLEQYFNVTLPDVSASFENMLQSALETAQKQQTIAQEQFLQTIQIAHKTKLAACIDPEFLTAANDIVIFDEHRSFQERALFLDQRLCAMSTSLGMAKFAQKLNKDLVSDELQAYARDIFIALGSLSSSFEVCKAKKSLQEMHKKYDLKRTIPEIVWNISRDLENFAYLNNLVWERPNDRILLDNNLNNCLVGHNGLLYGLAIKNQKYFLWAIDEKTLDGVWQVPIHDCEGPKFVLYNETIYLVDGMIIRAFNRKTGANLNSYRLKGSPVVCLTVDTSGLLYVVQGDHPCNKNTVITVDPVTGEMRPFESNIDFGGKKYFTAGQTFGYYYRPDKTITLYAKDGSKQVMWVCADEKESSLFVPCVTTKDNNIIFVRCMAKNNYHLVCYDTNNKTQVWSFPLVEEITTKPCISPDGQHLFITNKKKKKITALKVNGNDVQEVWRFEMPQQKQYFPHGAIELVVSPDGKLLFVLDEHLNNLYTINAHDGTVIATADCDNRLSWHLVGVSDDNLPYIQLV